MALLELKDLHTFFTHEEAVLSRRSTVFPIPLRPDSTLGVVGESGSGKSVSAMSILQLLDGNGYIDSGEHPLRGP